jgi:hypothetical protein
VAANLFAGGPAPVAQFAPDVIPVSPRGTSASVGSSCGRPSAGRRQLGDFQNARQDRAAGEEAPWIEARKAGVEPGTIPNKAGSSPP